MTKTRTQTWPQLQLRPIPCLAPGGSTCYSDLYGPISSTALGHQEICMWRPRSWESLWPLGATQAVEISPETVVGPQTQTCPWQQSRPGCHHGPRRHCRSPRSAWPSGSMSPKHKHAPRWQPRPQESTQPYMVTGANYTNTDPVYGRVTDSLLLLNGVL